MTLSCIVKALSNTKHTFYEVFKSIGFALLYFLMALIPLATETKMADVDKLINLGNLLLRKVTWLMLTTTSATLILYRAFGADCMTRIIYIYSRLPRTHSLTFFTYRDGTHSLSHSLHCDLQKQRTLSLSFSPLRLTKTTHSLSLILSIATYKNNALSLVSFSPLRLTKTTHSLSLILSIATYKNNALSLSHSLHCDLQKQRTLSLILSIATYKNNTLSFTFSLLETTHILSLIYWLSAVNPTKMYTFCNLFPIYSGFGKFVNFPNTIVFRHTNELRNFALTTHNNESFYLQLWIFGLFLVLQDSWCLGLLDVWDEMA